MIDKIEFPVYRKYVGIDTWFKITGEKEFVEIKRVGSKFQVHTVHATQFPEFQMIRDMISFYENRWEAGDKTEIEELLSVYQ